MFCLKQLIFNGLPSKSIEYSSRLFYRWNTTIELLKWWSSSVSVVVVVAADGTVVSSARRYNGYIQYNTQHIMCICLCLSFFSDLFCPLLSFLYLLFIVCWRFRLYCCCGSVCMFGLPLIFESIILPKCSIFLHGSLVQILALSHSNLNQIVFQCCIASKQTFGKPRLQRTRPSKSNIVILV